MSKEEYPFDSAGNYIGSWAAAGEKRAGRVTYVKQSSHSHYSSTKRSSSSSGSRVSGRYHTVRFGDTLWGLSRKYGKSVSSIKSANGLRSDTIQTGKKLRIP